MNTVYNQLMKTKNQRKLLEQENFHTPHEKITLLVGEKAM